MSRILASFAALLLLAVGPAWRKEPSAPRQSETGTATTRNADFITHPKSDLFYATSSDGLTFSTPTQVTRESGNAANLFPQLFRRHDGSWAMLWLSTRTGAPRLNEVDVSRANQYPSAVVENTLLPPGYSHRLTATRTPGVSLAAWVQGPKGAEDVYYRYIRR
jgi:hypothetical protein